MRVLFIDSVHPLLQERLSAAGYTCVEGSDFSSLQIDQELQTAQGVVIRSKFKITEEVLNRAPALQFIARSGSGLENIDLKAAKERGIHVFNSPEGNRDAVAEHAVGLLLSLLNHLVRGHREVTNGEWNREKNRGTEIYTKTVGIIGYGVMGKAFAQRLSGFGCRVIAHDKYKTNFSDSFAQEVTLEELQKTADVVSLHLPLTPETEHYCNASFIEKFEKPFYLLNTGRGKNVNTAHLVAALQTEKVIAAGLDVLEFESVSFMNLEKEHLPAEFQQLIALENVILSPHVAGWTHESYVKLSAFLANKILAQFGSFSS